MKTHVHTMSNMYPVSDGPQQFHFILSYSVHSIDEENEV